LRRFRHEGDAVLNYIFVVEEIPEDAAKDRSYPRDALISEEFLKSDGHKQIKDCPLEIQRVLGAGD
jgi:hypothetical protein